jgi:hypothetical protein
LKRKSREANLGDQTADADKSKDTEEKTKSE